MVEWTELVNLTQGYEPEGWNATADWVDLGCWAAHTPGLPEPLHKLRISKFKRDWRLGEEYERV